MFKKEILENKFSLAMNNVIHVLEENNISLEKLDGIEIFGGSGETDFIIGNRLKSFEIWEIEKRFEKSLKERFPHAELNFCDSIETLRTYQDKKKFDLIIIDNPMSIYGHNETQKTYCEHFEVLNSIEKIMNKKTIIIFLVNKKPFYYKKFKEKNEIWRNKRREFYGNVNIDDLSISFLISFYSEFFRKKGFMMIFANDIFRHESHLDYLIFNLQKENKKRIEKIDWLSLSNLLIKN